MIDLKNAEYKIAIEKAGNLGRQGRYKFAMEGTSVKVFMADFNDYAIIDPKASNFQAQVRALGYMLDNKLKLKNQHISRIWSAYRKFAGI